VPDKSWPARRDPYSAPVAEPLNSPASPESPAPTDSAGESPIEAGPTGEYWRWCPRCGHELHNEKCKLRCPRCHYFMSCSDFD
jgi:hypothetical protein